MQMPIFSGFRFSGTGKGVSAYILDTGILPSNKFFAGRAAVAYDAVKDGHKVSGSVCIPDVSRALPKENGAASDCVILHLNFP